MPTNPILEVRGLRTYFPLGRRVLKAVDDVSFRLHAGETLCIVGESGSGKSITARSILQIVGPPGRIMGGEILYRRADGSVVDIAGLGAKAAAMRALRGREIAMIFQEPMTSLSPIHRIGWQIMEGLLAHKMMGRAEARARAVELLRQVEIPQPEQAVDRFPFEFSGGMRQRAMIAMALACRPKVLIADEPMTALDVTIQAQVLDLIDDLRKELGTAVVLITHDLGVVAETAERMIVMYAGRKVEEGTTADLFRDPCHPYLQGLLASIPRFGATEGTRLREIAGIVPPLSDLPKGCAFAPRCTSAIARCHDQIPPLVEKRPGHTAACWVT